MNVIDLPIKAIKPYKNNPRKNDKAVEYVANSIRQFGFKVPIVIDSRYEIVCGHTRWKAAKMLGLDAVPCVLADDLSEEQIKAFRLADNKTAEMADWDFDLLEMELNDIDPSLFDMADFGFFNDDIEEGPDHTYTAKIDIPQYTPKGEKPAYEELCDQEKYNELVQAINAADISDRDKEFLKQAATRHLAFNYSKIANFYAHSDAKVQRLMEDSALVIIDFDDAIRDGYVNLTKKIKKIVGVEDDAE